MEKKKPNPKKQLVHRQRVQTEKENFWNRKRY